MVGSTVHVLVRSGEMPKRMITFTDVVAAQLYTDDDQFHEPIIRQYFMTIILSAEVLCSSMSDRRYRTTIMGDTDINFSWHVE